MCIRDSSLTFGNYIIVYAYPFNLTDEECDYIRNFAQRHGKKIVSIGSYQKCTDIFIPAHPLEVLPYFKRLILLLPILFMVAYFLQKLIHHLFHLLEITMVILSLIHISISRN